MHESPDGKAVAALVFGILSLVMGCFPFGIIAVAMGKSAMADITMGAGSSAGEGYARAGIILGWVSIGLGLLGLLGFLCAGLFMFAAAGAH
jgi:hypothetical protein